MKSLPFFQSPVLLPHTTQAADQLYDARSEHMAIKYWHRCAVTEFDVYFEMLDWRPVFFTLFKF